MPAGSEIEVTRVTPDPQRVEAFASYLGAADAIVESSDSDVLEVVPKLLDEMPMKLTQTYTVRALVPGDATVTIRLRSVTSTYNVTVDPPRPQGQAEGTAYV